MIAFWIAIGAVFIALGAAAFARANASTSQKPRKGDEANGSAGTTATDAGDCGTGGDGGGGCD